MDKTKPYILIAKDKFELNCDGWVMFLALKLLFTKLKEVNKKGYDLLCQKLVDCKAFDPTASGKEAVKEIYERVTIPDKK